MPAIDAPFTKSGSAAELYRALDFLKIPAASVLQTEWATTAAQDGRVEFLPRGVVAGLVPDVRNMGLKDAVYLLEQNGLRVRFAGRGTVLAQTPEAGAAFDKGDRISLTMSIND